MPLSGLFKKLKCYFRRCFRNARPGSGRGRHEREGEKNSEEKRHGEESLPMQLLRTESAVLLDLSLWISDMQYLHGREPLGIHVQRSELAVP